MALKASTALRDGILSTGSLKSILDLGFIEIYSGAAPATADAAIGSAGVNTKLCTISVGGLGTGITMDAAAASGIIPKNSGEVWKGTVILSGTASFYRHTAAADTEASSTTEPRLQGSIAISNAEMNFTNVVLTQGADQNIDFYSVAFPTL